MALNGGQGQKGGPADLPLLEELNGPFRVLLGLHHNVLHGRAQSGLQGHGILPRHGEQPGHRPADSPEHPPASLPHDGLDALGEAFQVPFQVFQQLGPAQLFVGIQSQPVQLLLGGLGPLFPALQPELIAPDRVFLGFQLPLGLFQHLPQLFGLLAGRGLPLGGLFRALFQGLDPQLNLPPGGLGRAQLHPLLREAGIDPGQLQGRFFNLPGGLVRVPAQLFQAGGIVYQLLAAPLHAGLLPGHVLPFLVHVLLGLFVALLGRLNLPLQPLGVLGVVGNLILQNAGLALHPQSLLVQARRLAPQPVHGGGAVVGLPVVFLGPLGQGLQLLLNLLVLGPNGPNLLLLLPQGPAGALQGFQPDADFQPLFLPIVPDELFGLFRLLLQRAHPAFQLRENVPQAHQILLGLQKPPLRLLLPVAEPGDARRLFKNLPPVLGFSPHNAVDFALADDGIAVPAQARVHKELVHVPQAHGAFVNQILALPGPVVPPGDGHLIVVKGQGPVSVVDGKSDLREAQSLALGGAAKDHVLHLGAAQSPQGLLPHHPAHGIADVAFSAAIGPHHRGDAPLEA